MAMIFQCDLCGRIDQEQHDDKHCVNCWVALTEARNEGANEYAQQADRVTRSQVTVLNLMRYLMDEKPNEFRASYGPVGMEVLREALGEAPAEGKGT